jgi:NAD(P)-dependent dehydrogenase (short-subunit alcohol dehydrogenase family)
VFMTGRREEELNAAVAEVGHNSHGVQGDVAILADLDRLFAVVKDKAGAIDILFANAGVGEFAALGEITEDHFDKIFAINVRGTLHGSEGPPPSQRPRFDHPDRLHSRVDGSTRLERL